MHKARIYSSTKSSGAGVDGLELQRIYAALITLGLKLRKSIAIKFVMGGSTALYSKGGYKGSLFYFNNDSEYCSEYLDLKRAGKGD